MKFFGYLEDTEQETPVRLGEVTLCSDPETLRRLSKFLLVMAERMEEHGDEFGHEHFEDFSDDQGEDLAGPPPKSSPDSSPAFIVSREH